MTDESLVLLTKHDGVALVSLNRPQRLNAVAAGSLEALFARGEEVRRDPALRAVVLTGEGRAFCAGADLQAAEKRREAPTSLAQRFPIHPDGDWPVSWFGINIPKPVVCAINGVAVGWGAEILLSCDMRVAAESARIGFVFAQRGLTTDMAMGIILLPHLVGLSQTARLLFSGEIIDAQEALRIGLVDEVVPDAELRSRAIALARHLGSAAPVPTAVHKRELYATLLKNPHDLYFENLKAFQRSMASQDFKEGVRAFMEKRPPNWTGR
ncbi:MAG: enoyl-CoA hydratase/isomerase family protein [Dehalococcoidia bacterium]